VGGAPTLGWEVGAGDARWLEIYRAPLSSFGAHLHVRIEESLSGS